MEKSKLIVIYDLAALPTGKRIRDVHKEFMEAGIVLWASKGICNMSGRDIEQPPRVIDRDTLDDAKGIKFVDTSEE